MDNALIFLIQQRFYITFEALHSHFLINRRVKRFPTIAFARKFLIHLFCLLTQMKPKTKTLRLISTSPLAGVLVYGSRYVWSGMTPMHYKPEMVLYMSQYMTYLLSFLLNSSNHAVNFLIMKSQAYHPLLVWWAVHLYYNGCVGLSS